MRKKLSTVSAFLIFASALSGCALKSQYAEDDYDIVATYIAHSIIEHDKNMAYSLVDIEPQVNELKTDGSEEVTDNAPDGVTQIPEDNTGKEDNTDIDNDKSQTELSRILGAPADVSVQYLKNEVAESYDMDAFVVEPAQGKELYIVTFTISNNGKKTAKISFKPTGISYILSVEGNEYKPLMTAIPNDMMNYENSIKASKKATAVLVFETEKGSKKDATIRISSDAGEYTCNIK